MITNHQIYIEFLPKIVMQNVHDISMSYKVKEI